MLGFVVAGVPVSLVVVAIVEAIKRVFKLEGNAAIVVAVVVGLVLAMANQAAQLWPAFAVWWETAIAGILLGFAACGLFDLGQAVKGQFLQ